MVCAAHFQPCRTVLTLKYIRYSYVQTPCLVKKCALKPIHFVILNRLLHNGNLAFLAWPVRRKAKNARPHYDTFTCAGVGTLLLSLTLPVCAGTVSAMVKELAFRHGGTVQVVARELMASPANNADETGFRVEGSLYWLHDVFCQGERGRIQNYLSRMTKYWNDTHSPKAQRQRKAINCAQGFSSNIPKPCELREPKPV